MNTRTIKKIIVCPTCKGTTKVHQNNWPDLRNGAISELSCPDCKNTGRVVRIVRINYVSLTSNEFEKMV